MFYFDRDKTEIKDWIKNSHLPIKQRVNTLESVIIEIQKKQSSTEISDAIQQYVRREINNQVFALSTEFQSQLDTYKSEIANQLQNIFQVQIDALQKEIAALKGEITALKLSADSSSTTEMKTEIAALKGEIDALKLSADSSSTAELKTEIAALKGEITALKLSADSSSTAELKTEVAALKGEIDALKFPPVKIEVEKPASKVEPSTPIKKVEVKPPKISTPPVEPAEKIFYIKNLDEIFITNDRENISAQIRKALNVDDMKNFLLADNSDISKKFQKLIDVHFKTVKSFADKLKLNDLDDEEISETVTSKYFKLFQQIIFDNILVAVKRGLKTSEKFYPKFLSKVNLYLEQCGIYTVNVKSGVKVTDEDYQNMTPQIIKTSDKKLSGIISEIERLPYRINYLDEFGEQKFFQYNGVMSVYKAV